MGDYIRVVANNVTELVGETPIVRLNKIVPENASEVFVKLEMFNPSKSVKERAAYNLIAVAEEQGLLQPGATIIEPASGNTGIGFAMNSAAKGYRAIMIMPDNAILKAAEIKKNRWMKKKRRLFIG
jgi:cysteine synthase A